MRTLGTDGRADHAVDIRVLATRTPPLALLPVSGKDPPVVSDAFEPVTLASSTILDGPKAPSARFWGSDGDGGCGTETPGNATLSILSSSLGRAAVVKSGVYELMLKLG